MGGVARDFEAVRYRVSVAIMRHLSIISYNSKAVATSQLKFSVCTSNS